MIGDKIRSAVGSVQDALRAGDLSWDLFSRALDQLLAAADQADALERSIVPPALRVAASGEASAPVVALDAYRRVMPARPAGRPEPTGGPAA